MINKIKLLTATVVLSLLSACGGGGGGDAAVNTPIVTTPIVTTPTPNTLYVDYYNKIINGAGTRQVSFETNREVNGGYGGGGLYYATALTADSFGGKSALSRTVTITISLPKGPFVIEEKEFFDLNYKRIGTINEFGYSAVTNYFPLSTEKGLPEGADFYYENVYSDSTMLTQKAKAVTYYSTAWKTIATASGVFDLTTTYYLPTTTYTIKKDYNYYDNLRPKTFVYYDLTKDLRYTLQFF